MEVSPEVSLEVSLDVSRQASSGRAARDLACDSGPRSSRPRPGRYLVRSGSVYIIQIRVPKDLCRHPCRPGRVSLGALTAREARIQADLMAAHARHCFEKIRTRTLASGRNENPSGGANASYGQGAPQFTGETAGEVTG